jgi:electron transfer flavoprotein alpha subunit
VVANADAAQLEEIGKAGAKKILSVKNDALKGLDSALICSAVEQAAKAEGAKVIVFAFDITGKAVAPRLSAKLKAGLVAGAVDLPTVNGASLEVKKNVFSGKATAVYYYSQRCKSYFFITEFISCFIRSKRCNSCRFCC